MKSEREQKSGTFGPLVKAWFVRATLLCLLLVSFVAGRESQRSMLEQKTSENSRMNGELSKAQLDLELFESYHCSRAELDSLINTIQQRARTVLKVENPSDDFSELQQQMGNVTKEAATD